jgi:hypothetical protein
LSLGEDRTEILDTVATFGTGTDQNTLGRAQPAVGEPVPLAFDELGLVLSHVYASCRTPARERQRAQIQLS